MPDRHFIDVLFEAVSAFTTTGLTMGITPELSDAGKCIEIVAMYIGRVGTLSVAYLFGRKVISTAYKYAEGHTLVG
jgi:trk system potassium uptake protein TrkH